MGEKTDWRYEWRIWGPELTEPRARLDRLGSSTEVKMSDDLYLVGPNRNVNAKVRNDVVETKVLVDVQAGFEQWRPDFSEVLPAPASAVARLLADLGLRRSALDQPDQKDAFGVDDPLDSGTSSPELSGEGTVDRSLLIALVSKSGLAVPVRKRRHHFTVGAMAIAEAVEVSVGDRTVWTVAIESTDVDELVRLRHELALDGVNIPIHVKVGELALLDDG